MTLLDDISSRLVAAAVGQITSSGTDWMIYQGYMQDAPDRAICLYETPGEAPLEAWDVDYPGFQVRVRGKADDYEQVRTKLQAAFTALHAQDALIGAAYVYVYARHSGAMPLGQDEKRRPALVQNYRVMKSR